MNLSNFRTKLLILLTLSLLIAATINIPTVFSNLNGPLLCFRGYLITPIGTEQSYGQGAIINFDGSTYVLNSCTDYKVGTFNLIAYVDLDYIFVKWSSSSNIVIKNPYNSSTSVQLLSQTSDRSYINLYIRKPWLYFHTYLITSVGYEVAKDAQIIFNGGIYNDNGVTAYVPGTYTIKANYPSNYKFDHWASSSTILINDVLSPSTTATLRIQSLAKDQQISLYIKGRLFNVTFFQKGVPSNLIWKVSIGNITKSALGSNGISFNLLEGDYQFKVTPIAFDNNLYYPNPDSGVIYVRDNMVVNITFYMIPENNGNPSQISNLNKVQAKLFIIDPNRNSSNLTKNDYFIGIVGEKIKFVLYLNIQGITLSLLSPIKILIENIIIKATPSNAFLVNNYNSTEIQTIIKIPNITLNNTLSGSTSLYIILNNQNNIALSFNKGNYTVDLTANLAIYYNKISSIILPIQASTNLIIDEAKIALNDSLYFNDQLILIFRYYWKTLNYPIYNKSGLLSVIILPFGVEGNFIDNRGYLKVTINENVVKNLVNEITGQIEIVGIFFDGANVYNSISYINYSTVAISMINSDKSYGVKIKVVNFANLRPISDAEVMVVINDIIFGIYKTDMNGEINIIYGGSIYSLRVAIYYLHSNNFILLPSKYSNVTLLVSGL
jgi:hypothetical protein